MKLTKEALEMLPAWIGINSRTASFFEWLMEEGASSWEHGDASIVKAAQGLPVQRPAKRRCAGDRERNGVCRDFPQNPLRAL